VSDSMPRHTHQCGMSGNGKSTFLTSRIRRDISEGWGVCVIDPHGQLYEDLVRWLEQADARSANAENDADTSLEGT
jgi:DNA helicase HerA-like ATPase